MDLLQKRNAAFDLPTLRKPRRADKTRLPLIVISQSLHGFIKALHRAPNASDSCAING
jgi:hypothetical protein